MGEGCKEMKRNLEEREIYSEEEKRSVCVCVNESARKRERQSETG